MLTKNKTKQTEPTLPFMIGSDPEFLMFFGVRGLDASDIISGFFRNSKYQTVEKGFMIPNVGEFGWDGSSSTAELRPIATKNIKTMIDNLHIMLKTITEKVPTVDLTTLSIGSPIGGHIHIDDFLHEAISEYNITPRNKAEKARVENIMATYLLPIAASDHRISALNRLRRNYYGKLTDFRYEKKSSAITTEIRGLTAEWMTTPEIAYATFAYITTVWHELKKRNNELSKQNFITRTKEQNETLQRMMLSDYKIIEHGLCQAIRKSIKNFELYPTFSKEIDFILKPEEVMNVKASVGWNINTGWSLAKIKKPSKKALMSPKLAKEILNKQNIPDIQQHFGISYNDDYNVGLFSAAIAERIAGLNWQLKHDYFLFGFKKAVNGYCAMTPDGKMFVMPNNQDIEITKETMIRMQNRINNNSRYEARIDPKTGQIRKTDSSQKIIIGIPYEDRAAQNTKNLIKLIYEIENKKITPQPYQTFANTITINKEPEFNLTDAVGNQRINSDRYDVSAIISNETQS